MNENLIRGLIFLAGVAAGGVAGYYLAKRKIGDEAAIDMAETREYYKKKEKELEAKHETELKYHTSKVVMYDKPVDLDPYFEEAGKDLHPEDEDEELKEQLSKVAMMEDPGESEAARVFSDSIYLISDEMFENDELGQEYKTVYFYTEDHVLCEKEYNKPGEPGTYKVIDNMLIGQKIRDALTTHMMKVDEDSDGDRVIWVRNEDVNTDYEVYVIEDYFYNPEEH